MGLFFGLAQGFNGATIYLFCAELFPARLRCQGMALSYNIGVSFLGGFAAAISQTLYLGVFVCVFSLVYLLKWGWWLV